MPPRLNTSMGEGSSTEIDKLITIYVNQHPLGLVSEGQELV